MSYPLNLLCKFEILTTENESFLLFWILFPISHEEYFFFPFDFCCCRFLPVFHSITSSRQSVKQSVTSHLHDVRSYVKIYSNLEHRAETFCLHQKRIFKIQRLKQKRGPHIIIPVLQFFFTHTTHTPIHTSVHIAFESFSSCEEYTEETCEHHQTYSF